MTKSELVAAMAEGAGMSRSQARLALDVFISTVTEALRRGDEVRLVGFGSFTPVRRPPGMARNPRTGAPVHTGASATCRFRAGDALKSALNGHG